MPGFAAPFARKTTDGVYDLMTATTNARSRVPKILLTLGVLLTLGQPIEAAINHYARISTYEIAFADTSQFSDAVASYDAVYVERSDSAGDTYSSSFAVRSGFYNYSHTSSPELNITSDLFNGTSAYSYSLIALVEGLATHTFHYDTGIASSFSESWIVSGITDGFYSLEFSGGGFLANILENNSFDLGLSIAGDWSQLGASTGRLEFLGIDPAWTIVKNFEYDESNGTTDFLATNANYAQFGGPNLHFRLYGAAVPEPPAIQLCALAAAGAVTFARRRVAMHTRRDRGLGARKHRSSAHTTCDCSAVPAPYRDLALR